MIGSKRDAANLDRLRELGVTHVLNVAKQVPNSYPNDFVYLKLDLVGTWAIHIYAFACSLMEE